MSIPPKLLAALRRRDPDAVREVAQQGMRAALGRLEQEAPADLEDRIVRRVIHAQSSDR